MGQVYSQLHKEPVKISTSLPNLTIFFFEPIKAKGAPVRGKSKKIIFFKDEHDA